MNMLLKIIQKQNQKLNIINFGLIGMIFLEQILVFSQKIKKNGYYVVKNIKLYLKKNI